MTRETKTLQGRCSTCGHWEGNKKLAQQMFDDNKISMDLSRGWPDGGTCTIESRWLTITIHGDACVETEIDANFGCVYWSE